MQSRRELIRTGGALAATGASVAVAGCARVPLVGSFFEEDLDYADWAYDPNAVDAVTQSVSLVDVDAVRDVDDAADGEILPDTIDDHYGDELTTADIDAVVSAGTATVFGGSFDPDGVAEAVSSTATDGHEGFDVYDTDEEAPRLLASDGSVLVESHPANGATYEARPELEAVLETHEGGADAFQEVNDAFATVHDEIGRGHVVSLTAWVESLVEDGADDDDVVAEAWAATLDDEETDLEIVRRYAAAEGIDLEAIEAEFEEGELHDAARDGPLVALEVSIPTELL